MNSLVSSLLQITAALLVGIQHNNHVPVAFKEQLVAVSGRVIQLSTQALASVPFAVAPKTSIWPNVLDLENAPYLDLDGNYVRRGAGVQYFGETLSFGDMNGDGLDDAAVLVQRTGSGSRSDYALAVLLNQGNILFNIADFPLKTAAGRAPQIKDHHVVNGRLIIDGKKYALLGNKLISVK